MTGIPEPISPRIRNQKLELRYVLVAHLARKCPEIPAAHVAADVNELARLGTRAANHATNLCSYEWYSRGKPESFDEDVRARIHKKAGAIAAKYGLGVVVGGDPRGYCLHLIGLPGNGWDAERGYGVE